MIVNRPEKIFFTFYSNLTLEQSEEYISKNFNYKMHVFPKEELDSQYKKDFENNIENLKKYDLFDEKLYKHGVYYNSNIKLTKLDIFFNIGSVDYKDIQFDLLEYYDYLFFSDSLLKILKEKDYITINNRINVYTHALIENNNIMDIEFYLSKNGLENLEEVLAIIYKYIDIMKKEGWKKEFFENYIKYKENINLANFRKFAIVNNLVNAFNYMTENYRLYGDKQIFLTGTPNIKNYNEQKLKELLNNINYEKSFFLLNVNETISNSMSTILSSPSMQTIKYYNANVLVGKIPNTLEERIINNPKIENLKMREINNYFSEKLEKDTPCYKKSSKKCKELNEFDFENEDKYNATLLEEDNKNYVTYYQIDKSSESYLVNAYLKLKIQENKLLEDEIYNSILFYYFVSKFLFINEVDSVFLSDISKTTIAFEIQCFSDNIERIFEIFLDYFNDEPEEYIFDYILNSFKNHGNDQDMPFMDYTLSTYDIFVEGGENEDDSYSEDYFKRLYNTTFEQFSEMYKKIHTTITSSKLKVAGNINKELVQKLHNIVKEKIEIIPQSFKIFKMETEVNNETSYVINYYTKSNLTSVIDNSIIVRYKFDSKYQNKIFVLMGCLSNIAMIYLRFNYSHSYSPQLFVYVNGKDEYSLIIYEQGRYKEVTEMEADINDLIKGILNGTIQCENYNTIVESHQIKEEEYIEKSYDNSYYNFFYDDYEDEEEEEEEEEQIEEEEDQKEINYPDTFEKLIDELKPIFNNPQKITILMARSDMSDKDFEEMVNKKKNTNEKYNLNTSIIIEHTDDIYYMKKRANR